MLGNRLGFEKFAMDPAYTNQYTATNPKIETVRDFSPSQIRQRVNRVGYLSSDSVSKTTLYVKEHSTGTRVHFGTTSFKGKNIMIISDVYLKNSGDQTEALKSSTEIIDTAKKWIQENEKEFQDIINDIS